MQQGNIIPKVTLFSIILIIKRFIPKLDIYLYYLIYIYSKYVIYLFYILNLYIFYSFFIIIYGGLVKLSLTTKILCQIIAYILRFNYFVYIMDLPAILYF